MRVLLSALALTALLLLAGAASVLAADGALPGDTSVTLDPVEPPPPPDADPAGSAVATVTQTAEPATQPVAEAAAPVVTTLAEGAAPVADATAPIVAPVVDVVAPAIAPIVDVVEPVADVVDPAVSPIVDVVDPVIQPVLDVVDPVTGPIIDVVDPVIDPGIDPVPPGTGPGLGVDAAGLAAAAAPAFDPNSVLSRDFAWFDGDGSIGSPRERWISHDPLVVENGTVPAETGASSPGSPGGLPWQGAPLGLPSGSAGPGGAKSLGAAIALLAAWMLAILLIAARRPWSSVPTPRGRSLLPALRPA
jgi:hypothetical protein